MISGQKKRIKELEWNLQRESERKKAEEIEKKSQNCHQKEGIKVNTFFVETHTHLDLIKRNIEEVVKEAAEKGVIKLITVGIDLESSKVALEFASRFEGVYAAVGFHPHEAKFLNEKNLKELEELAKKDRVVAIGEIGLDYYRKHSPRVCQLEAFKRQINLARKLNLPLIIHSREAHQDTLKILTDEAKGLKILLHCFSGDVKMAQICIKRGYYLGIGGVITFNNAKRLRAVVEQVPIENLVLETDSPYLAPHPFRGKPNEPKYIPLIAKKIAEIKRISIEEVAKITSINCKEIFGI
ncbi:MAG TPA: TatD family deoxyribonuclease [Candidatus Atribacteria bacterium]|nr:TatD family deoxyribonuclease [Candidatus Atribacteria bacterium]